MTEDERIIAEIKAEYDKCTMTTLFNSYYNADHTLDSKKYDEYCSALERLTRHMYGDFEFENRSKVIEKLRLKINDL